MTLNSVVNVDPCCLCASWGSCNLVQTLELLWICGLYFEVGTVWFVIDSHNRCVDWYISLCGTTNRQAEVRATAAACNVGERQDRLCKAGWESWLLAHLHGTRWSGNEREPLCRLQANDLRVRTQPHKAALSSSEGHYVSCLCAVRRHLQWEALRRLSVKLCHLQHPGWWSTCR